MWKSGGGRNEVFPWGDAQRPEHPSYAVGDIVYSGASRGTVVHASTVIAPVMAVEWDDGKDKYGAIIYPMNATFLRKAFPWER